MFGAGGIPLATTQSLYYLKSYGLLFVVGIVGATPLVRNIAAGISRRKAGEVLRMAVAAALLLICTAYLVDGSFNPFLYFRF